MRSVTSPLSRYVGGDGATVSALIVTLSVLVYLGAAADAQGQCETGWTRDFWCISHPSGPPNGGVYVLAGFDNGDGPSMLAGGDFSSIGGVGAAGIARWDHQWHTLGTGLSWCVYAIQIYDDGSGPALYAGGSITHADGEAVNNIVKWDGNEWSAIGVGTSGTVNALASFDPDGAGSEPPILFVGGWFASAGGVQDTSYLATWNGEEWGSPGITFNSRVSAMVTWDDGTGEALYVAGTFTSPYNHVAKWNGTSWSSVGGGYQTYPSALAVFDSGSGEALYLAGEDYSGKGVARWDGTSWSPVGSLSDIVSDIQVFDDGTGAGLYVAHGGYVKKWTGSQWTQVGDQFGLGGILDGDVVCLGKYNDGVRSRLFVGGYFDELWPSGAYAKNIAALDNGQWTGTLGLDAPAHDMGVFDDGTGDALYVAGEFRLAGGADVLGVARWVDGGWSGIGGLDGGTAYALQAHDDGSGEALYVGGDFTSAGGVTAHCVARYDGESWSPLSAGFGGRVNCFGVYDDGSGNDIYAGGLFSADGKSSQPIQNIARWNGSAWAPLGASLNGEVHDMCVFDDGSGSALYACGSMSGTCDGVVTANKVAVWRHYGWAPLAEGFDLNGPVYAIEVFDDGTGSALFLGGDFTFGQGEQVYRIAKWDSTSQTLTGLGTGVSWDVLDLEVIDNGSGPALYACGKFTIADGETVNKIAKWDGQAWSSLDAGIGSQGDGGQVNALIMHDDGSGPAIFAVGDFSSVSGISSTNIAKWQLCPPPVPGDMNGDKSVAADDIEPFVDVLLNPALYPLEVIEIADLNADGEANGLDIQLFTEAILSQS